MPNLERPILAIGRSLHLPTPGDVSGISPGEESFMVYEGEFGKVYT